MKFVIILSGLLIFISCSKDNEPAPSSSWLTVDVEPNNLNCWIKLRVRNVSPIDSLDQITLHPSWVIGFTSNTVLKGMNVDTTLIEQQTFGTTFSQSYDVTKGGNTTPNQYTSIGLVANDTLLVEINY